MIARVARTTVAALSAAALAAGCGDDEDPKASAASTAPSPILGAYEQRVTRDDLDEEGAYADQASMGIHRLALKPGAYESFTPKGPGIAGPGRAEGTRYTFDKDYRQDCTTSATYEVRLQGDAATLTPVGRDACKLREDVLTSKPWRRSGT